MRTTPDVVYDVGFDVHHSAYIPGKEVLRCAAKDLSSFAYLKWKKAAGSTRRLALADLASAIPARN